MNRFITNEPLSDLMQIRIKKSVNDLQSMWLTI